MSTFEHKYNKYKAKYNELVGGAEPVAKSEFVKTPAYPGPRCSVDVLIVKKDGDKYCFLVEKKKGITKLPGWVLFNEGNNSDKTQFEILTKTKNSGFIGTLSDILSTQNKKDKNYIDLSNLNDLKLISIKDIESASTPGNYNKGHLFYKFTDIQSFTGFEWEDYNLKCFAQLPNQVKYIPDLHMSNMD
jgi:hypothetical protein